MEEGTLDFKKAHVQQLPVLGLCVIFPGCKKYRIIGGEEHCLGLFSSAECESSCT